MRRPAAVALVVFLLGVPASVGAGASHEGLDPHGFSGTWIEYWPGVGDHDISVVSYHHGRYSVEVRNPRTGPFKVSKVRLEGRTLKFTEHPGGQAIPYEARVYEPYTIRVRVRKAGKWLENIIWRRQGPAPGQLPGEGGGDLVVEMRWQSRGTDVDLHVVEPNGERCWSNHRVTTNGGHLLNDCLQGPGSETYIMRDPKPGNYHIEVVYYSGGPPTQVAVEVRHGGNLLGTYNVTVSRPRERRPVHTVRIPAKAAPRPTPLPRPAPAPQPAPAPRPAKHDPHGLAGTWVEHYPGSTQHDVATITYQDGRYAVRVVNPKSGPYKVTDVRLVGNALSFTEHLSPHRKVHYELRVRDRDTLAARAGDGSTWREGIVWRRKR